MNSWDVRVFGPAVANLPRTKSTRTAYPAPNFSVWGCFPCYLQHFGPDRSYFPVQYLQSFGPWTFPLHRCSILGLELATCTDLFAACSSWNLFFTKTTNLKSQKRHRIGSRERALKGSLSISFGRKCDLFLDSCCYVVSLYFSSCCRQNSCSILAIESVFALYLQCFLL